MPSIKVCLTYSVVVKFTISEYTIPFEGLIRNVLAFLLWYFAIIIFSLLRKAMSPV